MPRGAKRAQSFTATRGETYSDLHAQKKKSRVRGRLMIQPNRRGNLSRDRILQIRRHQESRLVEAVARRSGDQIAISAARRMRWIGRFGHDRCSYCGKTLEFRSDSLRVRCATGYKPDPLEAQIDHIVPRAKGGNDDPANLTPACRTCNTSKGAKDVEDFVWGL